MTKAQIRRYWRTHHRAPFRPRRRRVTALAAGGILDNATADFVRLHADGWTWAQIAEHYRLTVGQVRGRARRHTAKEANKPHG